MTRMHGFNQEDSPFTCSGIVGQNDKFAFAGDYYQPTMPMNGHHGMSQGMDIKLEPGLLVPLARRDMEELSDSDYSEINELLEDKCTLVDQFQPAPAIQPPCISPSNTSAVKRPSEPQPQKNLKRRLWTKEEDQMLRFGVGEIIKLHGGSVTRLPWLEVSKLIQGRTAKQCRDRWGSINNVCTRNWTSEEDALLIELVEQFSNKWVKIARHFKDRNDNMVKSRYRALRKQDKGRLTIGSPGPMKRSRAATAPELTSFSTQVASADHHDSAAQFEAPKRMRTSSGSDMIRFLDFADLV